MIASIRFRSVTATTINITRWKMEPYWNMSRNSAPILLVKPLTLHTMGKGDKKTKKGKRTVGSRGKARPSKRRARVASAKKAGAKKAAKKAAPKKKAAKKKAAKKKK